MIRGNGFLVEAAVGFLFIMLRLPSRFIGSSKTTEGELQELRNLLAQQRAEKERLQQEQAAAGPGTSGAPSIPTEPN